MADTIKINADTSGAIKSIDSLEKSLGGLQDKMAGLQKAIAGLAIGSFIAQALGMADAMSDAAKAAGISTQALMGFGEAIAANGGNFESATRGIADFSKSIADAADGNVKAQEQFSKLGISLNDIGTLSEQDLLAKTVQGLGNLNDASQRASISQGMFGRAAKGVDFKGVANDINALTAAQAKNAAAIDSAGAVSDSLGSSYRELQTQTLNALKPIADLATSLLANKQAVSDFMSSLVSLVTVLGGLLVINKILTPLASLGMTAAATGTKLSSMIGAVTGVSAAWASMKNGLYLIGAALSGVTTLFTTGAGVVSRLGLIFTALLGGVARLIPIFGWLYTAMEAVNFIMKRMSADGEGLFSMLDKAGAALAKFFGISYQTSKDKETLAKNETDAAKAAKDAAEKKAAAEARVREVVLGTTKEIQKQLTAYKESNAEALKQIQNNTALIGLSEEQKTKQQALFDLEGKRAKEVAALNEKMNASELPEQKKAYADSIADVNAEYENTKKQIQGALDAQARKTRSEQLSVFANEQLVSSISELNNLNQQAATALLPELEKKYKDIEFAALNAAKAQIAAEERRRGSPLSEAERAQYLEAARVKVDELKAATEKLNAVERQRAFNNFAIKERIGLEDQLQKIQDDTAKLTMSEIQKKEYDILAAAKARAKAEINAAEAAKGTSLSADERQAYYNKAIEGVKALQDAERASYEESRNFSTGWEKAYNDYAENSRNAAKAAQEAFTNFTSTFEDSLVKSFAKGKLLYKEFLLDITQQLIRSNIKSLIAQVFGGGLDGGMGKGGTTLGNVFKGLLGFANGGMIPTNGPVIVGERGPEVLMGAAGRNVVPNNALGGSVTYNINAVDAMSFKAMVAADPTFLYAVTEQGRRRLPGGM